MEITMDPQWRSGPRRRGNDLVPQTQDDTWVDTPFERHDMLVKPRRAIRERHTTPRVAWGVARCGLVQRAKEFSQGTRCRFGIRRGGDRRALASKPGCDAP